MAKVDPRKPLPKAKITLDENCGKTESNFTSRKSFTNHVKTHSDDVFKCPPIWKEGPENQFNTKKALVKHIFEYHNSEKDCCKGYPSVRKVHEFLTLLNGCQVHGSTFNETHVDRVKILTET